MLQFDMLDSFLKQKNMCAKNKGMDSKAVRHLQRAYALTESLMHSESTSANRNKHQNKQNPFSAQMKLGFGTNEGRLQKMFSRQESMRRQGSMTDIDNIGQLSEDTLRMIMENLEVSDLKNASLASKKIKEAAGDGMKKKLIELVKDDQNLLDAIQTRNEMRANTLPTCPNSRLIVET